MKITVDQLSKKYYPELFQDFKTSDVYDYVLMAFDYNYGFSPKKSQLFINVSVSSYICDGHCEHVFDYYVIVDCGNGRHTKYEIRNIGFPEVTKI